MTKCGQPLLRRYLFLAAGVARSHDPDMAVAYQRAIDTGQHHNSATNVVAHRLVRRIYAVLRRRQAAREQRTQGLPVTLPAYRRTAPGSTEPLSVEAAHRYVRDHFPSKAARQRAQAAATPPAKAAAPSRSEAAEAETVDSGSSFDATTGPSGTPPPPTLAGAAPAGKTPHATAIERDQHQDPAPPPVDELGKNGGQLCGKAGEKKDRA